MTIILDKMIQFSRETEFLLNKNARYNDIFDIRIFCRVTEDIVISKLDCRCINRYFPNYKITLILIRKLFTIELASIPHQDGHTHCVLWRSPQGLTILARKPAHKDASKPDKMTINYLVQFIDNMIIFAWTCRIFVISTYH